MHIQGCRTVALVSTLTRRQLLYRAGTAAAAALAAEGGIAAAARGTPTVLVIGGGLAGLSAIRSLRNYTCFPGDAVRSGRRAAREFG